MIVVHTVRNKWKHSPLAFSRTNNDPLPTGVVHVCLGWKKDGKKIHNTFNCVNVKQNVRLRLFPNNNIKQILFGYIFTVFAFIVFFKKMTRHYGFLEGLKGMTKD